MEITINEKNENVLLNRSEVRGKIIFEQVIPSNAELTAILAKEMKVNSGLIVVKNIYNRFSTHEASFLAYVYQSEKDKRLVEMDTKYLRKKAEEDKKKAAEKVEKEKKEEKNEEKKDDASGQEEVKEEQRQEEAEKAEGEA